MIEDGRIPVRQITPEDLVEGYYVMQVGSGFIDLISLIEGANIYFTEDVGALAINSTGGSSGAFGTFKGTWQATPDELVWSQDFDTDLSPFTGPGTRVDMPSAVGTGKPVGYNYVDQGAATPGANASVNIGSLDLSTLPALSGRTPTRVKWWNGQKAVGNYSSARNVLFQVERGGVVGYSRTLSPNGFVTVTDAWSENECTVSAGNVVNWRITGGTTTPIPTGTFAFTGVRVYAIPVGWAGYDTNDFVLYQGQMYVSTTDANTSTPGAAGATWNLVPIYATAKTPNAQVGTTYTLALDDAAKTVTMTNAAASTLTVPPNSTVAFPVGTVVTVIQAGTGLLTIAAGAGVTVLGLPVVLAQYRGLRLVKTATDTWVVLPEAVPASAESPNAQAGTTYTLAMADRFRTVTLTNAAPITITVPTNATVPFPLGTRIPIVQGGAGGITISPAAGVTINNNAALSAQWQQVDLLKTGTDTWVVRSAAPATATPWQAWTPTLVNFTGTISWSRYKSDGKTCEVQFRAVLDATPTGRMEVTSPVAPTTGFPTGNGGPIGTCIGDDVGTARRLGATFFIGTNFVFGSSDVNSFWGVALPHGWVSGDTVGFNAKYEITP